jgi:hypothetical protein
VVQPSDHGGFEGPGVLRRGDAAVVLHDVTQTGLGLRLREAVGEVRGADGADATLDLAAGGVAEDPVVGV